MTSDVVDGHDQIVELRRLTETRERQSLPVGAHRSPVGRSIPLRVAQGQEVCAAAKLRTVTADGQNTHPFAVVGKLDLRDLSRRSVAVTEVIVDIGGAHAFEIVPAAAVDGQCQLLGGRNAERYARGSGA